MARLIKYNRNGLRKTNSEQPVPIGTVSAFAGAVAPGGWLICNGDAISRSTYKTLFEVISTTYGAGNGSTTFNIPDLRGRIPIGAGTGAGNASSGTGAISGTALTARTLGSSVGNESVTLSSTESGSPAHNHGVNQNNHGHTVTDTAHAHSIGYNTRGLLATGPAVALPDGFYPASYNMVASSAGWSNAGSGSGITVNNNNGETASSAHSNIPPVLVVSYIIKAL